MSPDAGQTVRFGLPGLHKGTGHRFPCIESASIDENRRAIEEAAAMYENTQAIRNPTGVTVFGSALLRVPPDVASLIFAVERTSKHPRDAFAAAREGAAAVAKYLKAANVTDVRSSRVSLQQAYTYSGGEQRFVGYLARIGFSVHLRELDRMEDVLTAVVDAGANKIDAVSFETTRLREVRAEARALAVRSARDKAQLYAKSAGIALGAVVHIEDVNPDVLTGRSEGHAVVRMDAEETALGPIDPGAIAIGGAVRMCFAILADSPQGPDGG